MCDDMRDPYYLNRHIKETRQIEDLLNNEDFIRNTAMGNLIAYINSGVSQSLGGNVIQDKISYMLGFKKLLTTDTGDFVDGDGNTYENKSARSVGGRYGFHEIRDDKHINRYLLFCHRFISVYSSPYCSMYSIPGDKMIGILNKYGTRSHKTGTINLDMGKGVRGGSKEKWEQIAPYRDDMLLKKVMGS
jgi:hypothetical protein